MTQRAVITGHGYYLPEKCLLNKDLPPHLETSNEWIQGRTGITQRYIADDNQHTSDLAIEAAKTALKDANLDASEIDLILLATTTPDLTFPATAVRVQQILGAQGCAAFDLQAVCSGFVYGLATADSFIRSGQYKKVLVIGAETMSRILDWNDRSTCVLFGDGAGAFVVESRNNNDNRGILANVLHADGNGIQHLKTSGGASSNQQIGCLEMNGKEVFRHAVQRLHSVVDEVLVKANLEEQDIDWLVPHQANQRIIDAVASRLSLAEEKVIKTVSQHANTSAASIPLAFSSMAKEKGIKEGDLILFEAMGGGFTWGATLARY